MHPLSLGAKTEKVQLLLFIGLLIAYFEQGFSQEKSRLECATNHIKKPFFKFCPDMPLEIVFIIEVGSNC